MQLTGTLALTFAVGAYAAVPTVQYVNAVVRDVTTYEQPSGLSRRQSDKCVSEAADYLSAVENDPPPTLDASLASALESYASDNDIPTPTGCEDDVSITGSVGSSYSSYTEEVMSWWSAHTAELQDFYSACSDVPEVSSITEAAGGCSSLLADITGDGKSSNDDDDDAAPRQTGAAFAAAGVAAAIAMVL